MKRPNLELFFVGINSAILNLKSVYMSTSISKYSDTLLQNIKDYNNTHKYVSFEPNISLMGSIINIPSSLGCIDRKSVV